MSEGIGGTGGRSDERAGNVPSQTFYVLLMRHCEGFKPYHSQQGDETQSEDYPALLETGERQALAVAARLRETLRNPPLTRRIKVHATWAAPAPEPQATAAIVTKCLGVKPAECRGDLSSSALGLSEGLPAAAKVLRELAKKIKTESKRHPSAALLVIGHEPQISWIADYLTQRYGWLPPRVIHQQIPIDRGEVVCLSKSGVNKTWRLAWSIHPNDKPALAEIREKIKSKMDTAKVMGAFITALIAFTLGQFAGKTDVSGSTWALRLATILLLFGAGALFFVSLFFYDTLLMPVRFWAQRSPSALSPSPPDWLVARPPSSSAWVLYQNMMRIWMRTFISATVLVALALLAFCLAILKPSKWFDWWPLAAALVGALLLFAWSYASRPRLGAQD
jgi:phosphohistidine phosphatase SixA